jgi:hypothetical protein
MRLPVAGRASRSYVASSPAAEHLGHRVGVPQLLQADDVGIQRGELRPIQADLAVELRLGPHLLPRVHPLARAAAGCTG